MTMERKPLFPFTASGIGLPVTEGAAGIARLDFPMLDSSRADKGDAAAVIDAPSPLWTTPQASKTSSHGSAIPSFATPRLAVGALYP